MSAARANRGLQAGGAALAAKHALHALAQAGAGQLLRARVAQLGGEAHALEGRLAARAVGALQLGRPGLAQRARNGRPGCPGSLLAHLQQRESLPLTLADIQKTALSSLEEDQESNPILQDRIFLHHATHLSIIETAL